MWRRRIKIVSAIVLLGIGATCLVCTYRLGSFHLIAETPLPIPELRSTGKLMLDGYCPVSLVERRKWIVGRTDCRVVRDGCEYHFHGDEERQQFLHDPTTYVPVLRGCDVTEFVDAHQLIPGKRACGLTYNRRIYLFKNEASLWLFSRHSNEFESETFRRLAMGDPFFVH
jgi:hypothetical protein